MYNDFVTALAEKEDLDIVKRRLIDRMERWHQGALRAIDEDYEDARRIRAGLDMPKDSLSYQFSAAFIEDALTEEGRKTAKEKRDEKIRREAEEQYMKEITERRMNGEYYE